ncbi:MAG: transglycosylase domain-containing protein [Desulfomicrobium escambiense]|nr:transglycosylase domain-containing protein [Desulfomicrobium escambiense]
MSSCPQGFSTRRGFVINDGCSDVGDLPPCPRHRTVADPGERVKADWPARGGHRGVASWRADGGHGPDLAPSLQSRVAVPVPGCRDNAREDDPEDQEAPLQAVASPATPPGGRVPLRRGRRGRLGHLEQPLFRRRVPVHRADQDLRARADLQAPELGRSGSSPRSGSSGCTPSPSHALPPYVPQAVVAIEDHRFFEHHGFDPRGSPGRPSASSPARAWVGEHHNPAAGAEHVRGRDRLRASRTARLHAQAQGGPGRQGPGAVVHQGADPRGLPQRDLTWVGGTASRTPRATTSARASRTSTWPRRRSSPPS